MTLSAPITGPARHAGLCSAAGLQPLEEWSIRLPRASRTLDKYEELDRQVPGHLRRITVACLRSWRLDALVETAALVVSELVTNAFMHGEGEVIDFRIARLRAHVLIEISDGTSWRPELSVAGDLEEGGRGLLLVASFAERWGYDETSTTMWCSLAAPAPAEVEAAETC